MAAKDETSCRRSALEIDAEPVGEPGPAGVGEGDDPAGPADYPAEVDEARQERGAEMPGEMGSLLGPVDAVGELGSSRRRVQSHPERAEALPAEVGQGELQRTSGAEDWVGSPVSWLGEEQALGDKGVEESNAEGPGEMVVAGAGPADRDAVGGLGERAHRAGRGECCERLEHMRDLGAGKAVVAVPARHLDTKQPAVDQAGEVSRDRGGGDPGLGGEGARSERPPAGQRDEHPGPGRLAHKCGHAGHVHVAVHNGNTTSGTLRASPKRWRATMATMSEPTPSSEPSSAAAVPGADPGERSGVALVAICVAYFMVILDTTVVNVALPSLGRSLHTTTAGLEWVVDAYSLVFAALLLSAGALSDRRGAKAVFQVGIACFVAASVACGLAPSTGLLVAARCAQGLGAALAVPASLALIQAAYPSLAERRRAFGIWGGIAGIAAGAGPVLGGALVAGLGWRSVFFVNLPIGIAGLLLGARHLPRPAPRPHGADVAGQIAGVLNLGSLTAALVEAGSLGWGAPLVAASLAVSAVAGVAFVTLERRAATPMLPLSLFASASLSGATVVGALINLGFYGELFVLTLFLQVHLHLGALLAGVALLPQMAMATIGSTLSGRVTARHGPRPVMIAGLALGAAGLAALAGLAGLGAASSGHRSYVLLVVPLVATGFGMAFTMPAATAAVMEAAPDARGGLASGTLNAARQTGGVIGVALLGTLVAGGNFAAGMRTAMAVAAAAFALGALVTARFVGGDRRTS